MSIPVDHDTTIQQFMEAQEKLIKTYEDEIRDLKEFSEGLIDSAAFDIAHYKMKRHMQDYNIDVSYLPEKDRFVYKELMIDSYMLSRSYKNKLRELARLKKVLRANKLYPINQ